ncbi:MAG: EI24 domain-containing protein [Maritimibacter harenae]|jgi:uncharacterized protein involved in cysteine biosynthesis|uniref:CysZ protein n=1 Tax=Maritimibacter harenae TaxID=2606218 RepID=A0A845LWZ5_9RHOB|nr:EI24 domain-containing protein [Maritimibacter harenae]MZR12315.1 hypothetical protein [Maritimibacter harenae]
MIFNDFLKALGQLGDRRFRKVLLMGLGLTIALLAGITIVLVVLIGLLFPETMSLPWIGDVNWLDSVASWAIVGIMLVLSPFLMVPVAVAFQGIFLDEVADAVEAKHYPSLPPAGDVSILDGLRDASSLIVVTIVINIIALILSFFIGPLAPILFWMVNGYLLGREYFSMAAIRREGLEGSKRLRRKYGTQAWIAGTLMAIPLTIPLVGLIMPVIGAATFTHMYHRVSGSPTR